MSESSIKIGSTIINVVGIFLFIMSLFWIFLTEVMFVSDVLAYTGWSYSNFLSIFPLFATLYIITKKLLGIILLVTGIFIILINHYSFKKGETWSWYALLITGIITWGSLVGYRIVIGYLGPSIVVFLTGTTLFIIGISIPAKEILGKKSS